MRAGTPRTVVRVLFGLTVAAILLITLWPGGSEGTSITRSIVDWLHANGMPAAFTYEMVEFTANIVMFVPFGLLLTLLLPRFHWWMAVVLSVAFTLWIEFMQAAFLPERFATVSDLVANTAGGLIGALLVLMFVRGARE